MPKIKILQEDQSYTFSSYFDLPYETDDILREFDYSFIKIELSLPQTDQSVLDELLLIKEKMRKILPLISLSSETARRETLVAPILLEIIAICNCQLKIEYPLRVSDRLKGTLDYLLQSTHDLLVIEAKKDDLTKGFTQLAVELIALSEITDQDIFYGAVTTGNLWQFGKLDKIEKTIYQDINLFKIPNDLLDLGKVLLGILA
ncbi:MULTISPECIES: hypothetical protein [Aphanizomenonaceae]|jgi:hypothetical protein|uniref:hypothetical protein n=1 Tax=Aphanizomenonaceae TaxID=1892259 RepID=UPI00054343BD|nr:MULTISPECIES: hypothetical protein [Aphanizomenonaceae]MDM3846467.1 hypothetical protein [Aphanizomenon gracile PMC638.10]MDM3855041.1 hypothetical protein [Aphanizomenon gracile PMC649.10]MDM3861043.1 hypothetical protein [Aphanizomenon gracile PMC644.10]QSV72557.1 MAG: hypothetical protein HEQ20_19665 [Aphanizomenon flos-aquae KM1D3_PB]KHG38933.1 hypothetical protein OA07_26760 [Aphanizomenon flos-aquae 2012/KM1/D3]